MVLAELPEIWAPWAAKAKETQFDPETLRRQAFVQEYGPYARKYGAQTGIAPEVLLAMGASESNWGAAGSIFGIKGPSPSGNSQTYDTWEAGPNGERIPQRAEFATYNSPDEAFQHFVGLLQTERYKPAADYVKQTGDSAGFLRQINDAGYATDRNWANSIVALANGMGQGSFPDAPPPGPGTNLTSRIQPPQAEPTSAIQNMARLVVNKRISADDARQAAVDEEARARLETDLARPMPALSHEISPPGIDTSVHPQDGGAVTLGLPATSSPSADTATLNTGDTPYASGQGAPGTLGIDAVMKRAGLDGTDYGSKITGALTSDLPGTATLKGAVQTAFDAGVPGTKGILKPGNLVPGLGVINQGVNSVKGLAGLAGVETPTGGEFIAGQLPATPLDIATSAPPGTFGKGVSLLTKGAGEADAGLGIIAKNKKQLASAMEQTLEIAKKASDDVLKAGGTAQEARQAMQQAIREAQAAEGAVQDAAMATDRAVSSDPFTNTGKRLRNTASEMSERMGSGAVGDAERTITGEVAPKTADEIASTLSAEADRLSAIDHPEAKSIAGDIAAAAKRLGDPASEVRRQLQQGGGEQQAAPGDFKGAAKEERAAREAAGAREADQAAIAARNEVLTRKGGGAEAVVQAARDRAAAAADAAEEARLALEHAQEQSGLRAMAGEARTGNEKVAQQEIAAHQARVEAADLEKRKAAWQLNMAQDRARAEARGYHEGGFGTEVVGLLGLPRAMSLAGDAGTVRDLGLLVGTKEGRQAIARGGTAGLRSIIHSDADARLVIDEANKGSRWFEWASDGSNLPGKIGRNGVVEPGREYHPYDFGAGASAESRVPEMVSLNESKISQAVEKYDPAIKFSDRALAVQRNLAGVDLLDSRLNEIALKYGVSGPEDAALNARFLSEAQSTIDSVNHLRGYSGGAKAKALGALNFFTSPQQLFSRLQVIGDPLNFALRGDIESAKFAAASLMGFATSQGALMTLAHVTGGPGRWSVNMNPASGDFGTIRVGNTRYDAMAGLGPTMRLAAKGGAALSDEFFGTDYAKNQAAFGVLITRWLANKEQPVSKMVTDYMEQNKLPNEQTAINMLAPSIATGFMQTLQEEQGKNKLQAIPAAGLNFLGVGVNSYHAADDYKRETADKLGLGDYNALSPIDQLKVLAQLPEDAGKNAKTPERQKYNESLNKAGYLEAPQDRKETDSEKKKRTTANADVIATHPDLDVQRWYWEGQDSGEGVAGSGSVHSLDAANQAAGLGIPNRPVHYGGADRNFAATDDDRKALKDKGNLLEQYLHPDPSLVDGFVTAAKYQDKTKYKTPDDARKAALSDVREQIRAIPSVDAALTFFGYGGNDNAYILHSAAAVPELQKLWDAYPKAQRFAKEGYTLKMAAGAK